MEYFLVLFMSTTMLNKSKILCHYVHTDICFIMNTNCRKNLFFFEKLKICFTQGIGNLRCIWQNLSDLGSSQALQLIYFVFF